MSLSPPGFPHRSGSLLFFRTPSSIDKTKQNTTDLIGSCCEHAHGLRTLEDRPISCRVHPQNSLQESLPLAACIPPASLFSSFLVFVIRNFVGVFPPATRDFYTAPPPPKARRRAGPRAHPRGRRESRRREAEPADTKRTRDRSRCVRGHRGQTSKRARARRSRTGKRYAPGKYFFPVTDGRTDGPLVSWSAALMHTLVVLRAAPDPPFPRLLFRTRTRRRTTDDDNCEGNKHGGTQLQAERRGEARRGAPWTAG